MALKRGGKPADIVGVSMRRAPWRRMTWVLIAWCALAGGWIAVSAATGSTIGAALPIGLIGLVILTLIWRLTRSKAPPPERPAASAGPTFDW
jgi:hypothetical protein